jgi:hypothetical protein
MIVIVPRSQTLFGAVAGGVIGVFVALLFGQPVDPSLLSILCFGGIIVGEFVGWNSKSAPP